MAARPRRAVGGGNLANNIKMVARRQMAEHGTAGLTLRAIARALGVTAPAIYHYYPSLDDLLTALIVDAYSALAEAMERAVEDVNGEALGERFLAATLTYRAWALEHPVEFQLIYGNPIPGYEAPFEVTAPLARRPFAVLGRIFAEAAQAERLTLGLNTAELPESVARHLATFRGSDGATPPAEVLYALVVGWTRIHGIVTLELFHHLQPLVGDPEAMFRHEALRFLNELGFADD